MPQIEGYRVQNFGVLKDIKIGRLWNDGYSILSLTQLVAVIGKNGCGKSTLFDSFGFLSDCLTFGVEEACDSNQRGGFDRIISMGVKAPISFEIYYRETTKSRPITYELQIDKDSKGRPYVKSERFRQRRKGQRQGWPFSFLIMSNGEGWVWKGESVGKEDEENSDRKYVNLTDARKLGIATLGQLKEHPRITQFRDFMQNWYLSYFNPDSARSLPMAGPQQLINRHGDNFGNVVQYLERESPDKLRRILESISTKIPGIKSIYTTKSEDGRLLLRFNETGFKDPLLAQQMSDGTLKLFAYYLLLNSPNPPPFICIEEPENGLYHKLLEDLAFEFKNFCNNRQTKSQVFLTTHQPYLIDALTPEETWILEKGTDGFSKINHAVNYPHVKEMVSEGQPLGSLWYSDFLDER